jgi:cytochrome c oxidase subunit 2
MPVAASSYAGDIDRVMWVITIIVGIWFLAAEGVLLWFTLRYRKKEGVRATYVPGRGFRQTGWILIPCVAILACDFAIDAFGERAWAMIKEKVPPAQLSIGVEGRQWSWTFTHPGTDGRLGTPDDIVLPDEIHVPVGVNVAFSLGAADVLHSFWIPELRLKQDAVPGRRIQGWFRATRPGSYGVLCAELCGAAHGTMRGTLHVDTEAEYERWLASRTASKTGGKP